MNPHIRIAIIGGGLAGASLIKALIKFSHLDVHIYEAATEFKETGMAVGVARNAQAALELIGPSAAKCLDQAGAVPMRGVKILSAQGEGVPIGEVDEITQGKRLTSIVHRAELLQVLLADVPKDRYATRRVFYDPFWPVLFLSEEAFYLEWVILTSDCHIGCMLPRSCRRSTSVKTMSSLLVSPTGLPLNVTFLLVPMVFSTSFGKTLLPISVCFEGNRFWSNLLTPKK